MAHTAVVDCSAVTGLNDPAFFDRYAHEYDDNDFYDPATTVDFLADLAPARTRALELAVGAGRVERYADRQRSPFTADGRAHVSVYAKP